MLLLLLLIGFPSVQKPSENELPLLPTTEPCEEQSGLMPEDFSESGFCSVALQLAQGIALNGERDVCLLGLEPERGRAPSRDRAL